MLLNSTQAITVHKLLVVRDAWGSRPSGIHYGNLVDYGNFDQCYNYVHTHPGLGQIEGQYCLLHVQERNNSVIQVPAYCTAVCVPVSCKPTEVVSLLQNYLNEQGLDIIDENIFCEKLITLQWSPLKWFSLIFFLLSICIVATATAFDLIQRHQLRRAQKLEEVKKPWKFNYLVTAFSFYSNLSNVMSCSDQRGSSSGQSLNCLHGIRGLSVLWIIYQHTYYMQMSFSLLNDYYKVQVGNF